MESDPLDFAGQHLDPQRRDEIQRAALTSASMQLARFYFASSEYVKGDLADMRSNDEYFETLENSKDAKEKRKMRQAVDMVVRYIDSTKPAFRMNAEEQMYSLRFKSFFCGLKFIAGIDAKRIARWPRIVINDSEYNGNSDTLTISDFIPEKYREDGATCEIDYDSRLELDEVEYKRRPQKTFGYKSGQINLGFVKNMTSDIESLIVNKLKNNFGSQRTGDGFSVHHLIPRKKLEIFFNLKEKFLMKDHALMQDRDKGLYKKRIWQYTRLTQISHQFREKGLMTDVQPHSTQMCDQMLCKAGNTFYGPRHRSDDDCNGLRIDRAAAIVLSEDEYTSVVRLDDELNEFLKSYGLRVDQPLRSTTVDSFMKEAIEPIPFDPRLVDKKEGESRWFYRRRKIAKRSLPDWLLTLLQDVSQELKVELLIDLKLTPTELRPDIDQNMLRIQPRSLAPDFIASNTDIYIHQQTL